MVLDDEQYKKDVIEDKRKKEEKFLRDKSMIKLQIDERERIRRKQHEAEIMAAKADADLAKRQLEEDLENKRIKMENMKKNKEKLFLENERMKELKEESIRKSEAERLEQDRQYALILEKQDLARQMKEDQRLSLLAKMNKIYAASGSEKDREDAQAAEARRLQQEVTAKNHALEQAERRKKELARQKIISSAAENKFVIDMH